VLREISKNAKTTDGSKQQKYCGVFHDFPRGEAAGASAEGVMTH